MFRITFLLIAALPVLAAPKPVDFGRDIRPILSDNCFACHGPDEKQRLAGLRLDTRDGAFSTRPSGGAAIVPGRAADSLLYQRISADKPALRMPPAHTGRALSADQAALIRRWIDEGANWETHWSYLPPKRPELPEVRQRSWPRNPIDHFVLARLEQERLRPSREADRRTLLRRVTLDLTGLPPTLEELNAFLNDRSPRAYEKVVDRLLASKHYGEKMALPWLDLARYADTHGYHIDSHRDMWPWRDWVIRAFNANMPYNQFMLEQLAGDLLDEPTLDQRIATGFNRNHMINFEGGAIDEEYLTEYVVDRVETTANVFLGMTMGCARCHDHKYDPVSQRDFYRFFAFFNTVAEKGLDGRRGNAEPMVRVAGVGQEFELDECDCDLRMKREAFPESEARSLQAAWEPERIANPIPEVKGGVDAHFRFDDNLDDSSGSYHRARILQGAPTFGAGNLGRALTFDPEHRVSLGAAGKLGDTFSIALWIRPSGEKAVTILQKQDAAGVGWKLYTEESFYIPDLKRGARIYLTVRRPGQFLSVRSSEPIIFGQWTHATFSYDGSAVTLYLNGEPASVETVGDRLNGDSAQGAPLENVGSEAPLEIRNYQGAVDDLRIFSRGLTLPEIARLATHMPADAILSTPSRKRSRDERARLREYYLTHVAPEHLRKLHAEITALTERKEAYERATPTAMVMRELTKPRDTFILKRGQYDAKTEKVTPGVPSILPPLPADVTPNRLTLARWLADPDHPLTARVAVNRFWQSYFGVGLVKTAEDFGSQGEPPSHPQLLDWLATEFVNSGWDVKALQRLIVTSATYRQSSGVTPGLVERDPDNRLMARMSRFRLPAELVRDNALALSGLINPEIGGPSVYPYQPPGLWEEMAYFGVYSAQTYKQSTGKDLYRRGIYTFWKRTVPPAAMTTFDAPDREKCTARRLVTNTPLQALVLMNSPTYVEAARVLAQRVIREASAPTTDRRLDHAFQLVTMRTPSPKERAILRDLVAKQISHYAAHPDSARALLAVGDSKPDPALDPGQLAAWTNVAGVLLSMDEAITKE